MFMFFFFKQKTAYEIKECDWSSDVCSSDLDRAARTGRNPKTGEAIQIAASKNPAFKAGKALKDAVN